MKAKVRSKISKPGVTTFSNDTIQAIVQEEDVSPDQIEAAIVFTHLLIGLNPYINPTATLGFMIEALSVGMDDQSAIEFGQLIARTAKINGPQKGEEDIQ